MTQIYIVRHGETVANTLGLLSGQSETPLTETGQWQAKLLGRRLADVAFTRIFVSDLGRVVATAEVVAAHHPNVAFEQHRALRECSWGEWEKQPFARFNEERSHHSGDIFDFKPAGGESLRELKDRATEFVGSVLAPFDEGTHLIVAHSVINKALICNLLNRPWTELSTLNQRNTCVNIIQILRGEVRELCLNCIRHLECS
jgi:broad specificity phosphatase PhoE